MVFVLFNLCPIVTHLIDRGFTDHQMLDVFNLINMGGRVYDPVTQQFLSPDPYVQLPDNTQNLNRYAYCLNSPLMYTDPTGEKMKWWGWLAIGLGVDMLSGGAISAGAAIAASMAIPTAAATVPTAVTAGGAIAGGTAAIAFTTYIPTVLNIPILASFGLFSNYDGKNAIKNSFRITNGLFVTDKNKNFFGRVWEFTSRFTWEGLQTTGGLFYTQGRNLGGQVDRVDYFGGATWATKENSSNNGFGMGNYININYSGTIDGNFKDFVLNDQLFMHEYGHTIDSRKWGFLYLLAIGAPSIDSYRNKELIKEWNGVPVDNPLQLNTHHVYWTEIRANRNAAKYFGKYYGIDWIYPKYPLSNPFK